MKFDLHLHSWFSDGKFSPSQLAEKCKEAGLEVISLTDHEHMGGIAEAIETGRALGIRVIPGIEFSSDYQGIEYHILGYFIDYNSQKLKEFLDQWRMTKIAQIEKILDNLRQFGFEITIKEVMAQAKGNTDRVHISSAVFQNPDNLKILEAQGINGRKEFFRKYLMEKPQGEGLAFAERERPPIKDVIGLIRQINGLAFWAHPFFRIKDAVIVEERVRGFQALGLQGLEVGYSLNTIQQTSSLHYLAEKLSLFESGGSDFHGSKKIGKSQALGEFQAQMTELNFPFGGKNGI